MIPPVMLSTRFVKHLSPQKHQAFFRCFSNAKVLRKSDDEVPFTTHDGSFDRSTLHVNQRPSSPGVVIAGDITRKAEMFDKSILPRLNQTMRKFTLDGKVAIVTG